MTRRASSKALPAVLRRNKCLWTPEEDALLTREWGELAERSLREKLGRSANAILLRARFLNLPPQAQGRTLVTHACRDIGLWHDTLYRLLDECGLRAEDAAPLRPAGTRGETRHLAVDADAAAALLALRDARTQRLATWARSVDRCPVSDFNRLTRFGLRPATGGHVRYPIALLEEASRPRWRDRPTGPWCDLWLKVIARTDLPTAPWVVALAAWDLVHADDAGRAWIEHLPLRARDIAAELAASIARPEPVAATLPSSSAPPADRARRAA